jgi:hypothetical protein
LRLRECQREWANLLLVLRASLLLLVLRASLLLRASRLLRVCRLLGG